MKVYHGTSFESACQILSEPMWELPYGVTLQRSINFFKQHNVDIKDKWFEPTPSNLERWGAVHFSTNLETAISYAKKHAKGVVLWVDDDSVTTPCDDFYITAPIYKTKDVNIFAPMGRTELKYKYYWLLRYLYKIQTECEEFYTFGDNDNAPSIVGWSSKGEAKRLAFEILDASKNVLGGADLLSMEKSGLLDYSK